MLAKAIKLEPFMNIRVSLGLYIVVAASLVSVRAADNPAQAAARAVLEQKLSQPDAWVPQPLTPVTNTAYQSVSKSPAKPATTVAMIAPESTVAPPTAPAASTPAPAPAPTIDTPSSATPVVVAVTPAVPAIP